MEFLKDLEQKISERMFDFYGKEMGLRPSAVHTAIQGDLIIIRFENVLSPSEINLIKEEDGKRLVREVHEKLTGQIFPSLQSILLQLTGKAAVEIDIELHERGREKIFLVTMEAPFEEPSAHEASAA